MGANKVGTKDVLAAVVIFLITGHMYREEMITEGVYSQIFLTLSTLLVLFRKYMLLSAQDKGTGTGSETIESEEEGDV